MRAIQVILLSVTALLGLSMLVRAGGYGGGHYHYRMPIVQKSYAWVPVGGVYGGYGIGGFGSGVGVGGGSFIWIIIIIMAVLFLFNDDDNEEEEEEEN